MQIFVYVAYRKYPCEQGGDQFTKTPAVALAPFVKFSRYLSPNIVRGSCLFLKIIRQKL